MPPQDMGDVNVHGREKVVFGAPQHLWGLHILDGAASVLAGRSNTIVTKGLDVSGTGTIDLADNAMIIKVDEEQLAGAVADVNAMIRRGLTTGTGLISTTALSNGRL